MKKHVTFTLSIGFNSRHKESFHMEDDLGIVLEDHNEDSLEEEIHEHWKDWIGNYIEGGWEIHE